jgi:hypothetical protein
MTVKNQGVNTLAGAYRVCPPNFLEEFFSETQKAIREEKGRGVENPGGKASWT